MYIFLLFLFMLIVCTIVSFFSKETAAGTEAGAVVTDAGSTMARSFIKNLCRFLYFVSFLYFSLNLYYHLIAGYQKTLAYFRVTAAIIAGAFLYHLLLFYVLPIGLQEQYTSVGAMFRSLLSGIIPMLVVSFLIAYLTNMQEALKQRRVLQEQKLQLEMEITQANFNFLKAQINPHFLHNTLNFLYAKSLPYSPELSEGILTLSDIMRYALNEETRKDGKAPLKDEVEHVHNMIRISQLRFNNTLNINFRVTGSVDGLMIAPLVLITLVENAFKHGDLKNSDFPVDIQLQVEPGKLYCRCSNKKKTEPNQLSTGIGLDNIKKRLDLTYGEHYQMVIKDEPDFYTTELTIDPL